MTPEQFHAKITMDRKAVLDFVRMKAKDGVTALDLKVNGMKSVHIGYLTFKGYIKGHQVKEPKRGPRAYHWGGGRHDIHILRLQR